MDYMHVKDYTETVSVRLSKQQVAQLKRHAQGYNLSQSDFLRMLLENLDVLPMIPAELKAIIRQKTDAATRGQKIVDVLNLHFNSWLT